MRTQTQTIAHGTHSAQTLAKMALTRPNQCFEQILAEGDVEGSLRALRVYPEALANLMRADKASIMVKRSIEDILGEVGFQWLT